MVCYFSWAISGKVLMAYNNGGFDDADTLIVFASLIMVHPLGL